MAASDGIAATPAVGWPPPGPRAISVLRPLVSAACGAGYLLAGEWLIRRLFAHYGPVVSIPLPGIPAVLIKDPELVKQVFTENPDILLGGRGVRPSALIYGTGSMFVQEEPEHLRRRKLLTPPLHGKALENYRPIIEDSTRRALAAWPTHEPFKLLPAARELALDVIVGRFRDPRTSRPLPRRPPRPHSPSPAARCASRRRRYNLPANCPI